jgi:hypothetical protein
MNAPLIENVRNSNLAYHGTKYIHHPLTSGQSWYDFQMDCFGFYLADFYFIKYLDYNIFKTYRPYMQGIIPKGNPLYELANSGKTSEVTEAQEQEPSFYESKVEKHPVLHLDVQDRALLFEIKKAFEKHHTTYCILFPPNQEVEKIDLDVLREYQAIFGENSVFDFTGKNEVIFSDSDFVDDVHFKPVVARRILDKIKDKGLEF